MRRSPIPVFCALAIVLSQAVLCSDLEQDPSGHNDCDAIRSLLTKDQNDLTAVTRERKFIQHIQKQLLRQSGRDYTVKIIAGVAVLGLGGRMFAPLGLQLIAYKKIAQCLGKGTPVFDGIEFQIHKNKIPALQIALRDAEQELTRKESLTKNEQSILSDALQKCVAL